MGDAGEEASQWPLEKFRANLAAASGSRPENGFAVVVTTGAMNPIHRGHVQLLHQAKQRLDEAGFCVLGAWVSPSHDDYVQPKCRSLRTIGLTSDFRVEAARRATADDKVVACGSWEAEYPGSWPDFPEVVEALRDELAKLPWAEQLRGPSGNPQVFYACGTDHAEKCGLYGGLWTERDGGVVVVPRAGDEAMRERPEKRVYVAEPASGPVASVSSTQVRASVAAGDHAGVCEALSPGAAEFLLRPTTAEYDLYEGEGSKNYSKLKVPPPS